MSQDNRKVSVCLMTYNGAATVERALTTLLAQTYRDYELIISDDHSTDETLAICQRVAAGHKQVRFIRPRQNLGAEHNMKFALSHSRGKYFVWACQDDYWEPDFLRELVKVLEETPTAVSAQGGIRWISEDGARARELRLYGRDRPERQSRLALAISMLTAHSREKNIELRKNVLKNNIFMHGVLDRAAFAAALEAQRNAITTDRQILCQLALAGEFRYVDRILLNKVFYDVKLHKRRPATDTTVMAKVRSNRWLVLWGTLVAIVRSRTVTMPMKVVALPVLFSAYCWRRLRIKSLEPHNLIKTFRGVLRAPIMARRKD